MGPMRSLSFAAFALALSASPALAVAVGPDPPDPDAATIASLVNQYLQTSAGADTTGGWLDAAPAGDVPNRGQSLIVPKLGPDFPPPRPAGTVKIDQYNNSKQATVSFNDGAGHAGTAN